MKTYKMVEWSDIIKNCLSIKSQIVAMDFRPDAILGIMRGGVIPATILADIFMISKWNLFFMETEYYGRSTPLEGIKVGPIPEFRCGNLLVVDDICDSGVTMNAVIKAINKLEVSSKVVFSSLYWKIRPDSEIFVAGEKAKDDEWLVFPWEFYSSVGPQ